jgi:TolB-like protein/Tfp pilus assembly protein PilF
MSDTRVRQLSAIMFTDMVGYTALMQADERKAKAQRDRHRSVLTSSISDHHGDILQYYGDGTLSVFRSAIEAVLCAIRIQTHLQEDSWIPIRIGIHTGDIVYDGEGAYGDGVNVASRIESLAPPGGVLISGKVYDEVKNQPEVVTRPLGRVHLKNVQRPVQLFAVANDGIEVPTIESVQARAGVLERSVAVLPFVNMSADPENEFFADGITEEIINALTRIEGLKVTARTSSFAYKGHQKDVRTIGAELQVGTVMEGSVRKAGDRVRITAQLINADDGYHLFSEAWNRKVEDIFEVQDEIARRITQKLEAQLSGAQSVEPLVKRPTRDLEAYNLFLKSQHYWNKWTPDSVRKATAFCQEAIERDPGFALPYAGLAFGYSYLGAIGAAPPKEIFPRAKEAALKAIELDDTVMDSRLAMGLVKLFFEWDFKGAREQIEIALRRHSGSADSHHVHALYLSTVGKLDEAVAAAEISVSLDPLSMPARSTLAQALFLARRPEDAQAEAERLLELEPTFRAAYEGIGWVNVNLGDLDRAIEAFQEQARLTPHPLGGVTGLGYAYGRAGRLEEARECLEKTLRRRELEPEVSVTLDLVILYAGLRDTESFFRHLDQAIEERLGGLIFMNAQPLWDEYRADPRFQSAVRRVGLPEPSLEGAVIPKRTR